MSTDHCGGSAAVDRLRRRRRPLAAALLGCALALQLGAPWFRGPLGLSWVLGALGLVVWWRRWCEDDEAEVRLGRDAIRRRLSGSALRSGGSPPVWVAAWTGRWQSVIQGPSLPRWRSLARVDRRFVVGLGTGTLGVALQALAVRRPLPLLPLSWALLLAGAFPSVSRPVLTVVWETWMEDASNVFGWPRRWASPGTVGILVGILAGLSPFSTDLTVNGPLLVPATLAVLICIIAAPPWSIFRAEINRSVGVPRMATRLAAVRHLVLGIATGLCAAIELLVVRPGLLSGRSAWTWSPCITYWSPVGYHWVGCHLSVALMVLPTGHYLSFIILTTLLPFWAVYLMFVVALIAVPTGGRQPRLSFPDGAAPR